MKTGSHSRDWQSTPRKLTFPCALVAISALLTSCNPVNSTRSEPRLELGSAQAQPLETLADQSVSPSSLEKNLVVEVRGVTSSDGRLRLALYRGKDDFNQPEKAYAKQTIELSKQEPLVWKVTLDKNALQDGQARWALSAHHDKNSNDKLDKNAFGIPTEPYGFSNNPKRGFGPPSFDEVSFELDIDESNPNKEIDIKVQ